MSAQRKLIRRAAADALMNHTLAGANVFASRSAPLWEGYELPAICVYGMREVITLEQESPRKYRRELELRIEVAATGADADDTLDDIGNQIEQRIGRSNRLTYAKEQTVADILLAGEQLEYRTEGKKTIGALVISYTAVYYSYEPDELDSEPVDDFKSVDTDYSLNNAQAPAERASDLIEGLDV